MPAVDAFLTGPLGSAAAIAAMTASTMLCRAAGYLVMGRIRMTPFVEAFLTALPGSIVAATVAPLAIRSGPAAILGVLAVIATARLARNELAAFGAGLAVAAGARALGV